MKAAPSHTPPGWLSLPNEIRLNILSYIIPLNESYEVGELLKPGYTTPGYVWDYHNIVLPLLCIPEVREIVSAEFHGNNDIGMYYGKHWTYFETMAENRSVNGDDNDDDDDEESDPLLLYPPKYARPHLRRFEIIINEMTPKIIDFLALMGTQDLGLETLDNLDLTFACAHKVWYYDAEIILQRLEKYKNIQVLTRRLGIVYQHHVLRMVPIAGTRWRECKDVLEVPLLEKLSVKVKEQDEVRLVESWKRFSHHSPFEKDREFFATCPRRKLIARDRTTIKVVEVMYSRWDG